MNNFLYNDNYFNDIIELTDYLNICEEEDMDDNFEVEVEFYDEKPIFNFDRDKLVKMALTYLEKSSDNNSNLYMMEDVDDVFKKVEHALKCGYVTFEKYLPTMCEPNGKKQIITKADIIAHW